MFSEKSTIKNVVALVDLSLFPFAGAVAEDPSVVGGVEAVGYTSLDPNTGAYNQPGWVQRRPFSTTRNMPISGRR